MLFIQFYCYATERHHSVPCSLSLCVYYLVGCENLSAQCIQNTHNPWPLMPASHKFISLVENESDIAWQLTHEVWITEICNTSKYTNESHGNHMCIRTQTTHTLAIISSRFVFGRDKTISHNSVLSRAQFLAWIDWEHENIELDHLTFDGKKSTKTIKDFDLHWSLKLLLSANPSIASSWLILNNLCLFSYPNEQNWKTDERFTFIGESNWRWVLASISKSFGWTNLIWKWW